MSLEKLRELTAGLPIFPSSVEEGKSSGFTEYKMDKGICYGWYLYTNGTSVGVHKWFNSRGTEFPAHAHSVQEVFIIYEGEMLLTHQGKEILLKSRDSYYVNPNELHGAMFKQDCRYITITMPPAKEFPGGFIK